MTRHLLAAAVVIAVACPFVHGAAAQTLTFDRELVPSHGGARGATAADFDRDGWVDLAHANYPRNTVTVLLNARGAARSFAAVHDVPVGAGAFDVTSADFNRDGIPDLAVANADGASVSILRGLATGGFARTDVAVPAGPRGLAAGDVNRDGRTDLVVTGWTGGTVRILIGNGAGAFSNGPLLSVGARPQGVALADFNRDGFQDIAVAHESGTGLSVWTGNAAGTSFTGTALGGASLNVLAVGDLNRDGRPDVAAASSAGNLVAVYLGTAAGLRLARTYATGASPRGILLRDLDVNGLLDIITANRSANSITVLAGAGGSPGTFLPGVHHAAGAGSRALAADDFDRDGRVDLAVANQDAAAVTLLWNDTDFETSGFSFRRESFGTPSSSWGSAAVPVADFNEDGKLDAVVRPDYTVGRVVHVLLTDGPAVALGYPEYAGGYDVGDFNNDGHADVIVTDGAQVGWFWVYFGDGRGAFTRAPETRLNTPQWGLALGHVNGDRYTDLVFVTYDRAAGSYALQVLTGTGTGTFTVGSRFLTSSTYTSAFQIVDVTRDGRSDIVVFVGGNLTVFAGNGAGAFTFSSSSAVSPYPLQHLALADLDNDGWLDAVAGEQGRVRVSKGLPGGGFATPAVIQLEGYSNWAELVIGDIDLDGKLDIIGGAGFILRGRGDGTFGTQERYAWDAPSLTVVDFTRDGLPDIVMPASHGAYDVVVNTRNGTNRGPAVDAGPERTFRFEEQYLESPPEIFVTATDEDLHFLTYEWRDPQGNVVPLYEGPSLPIEGYLPGTYTFTVTVTDGRGGSATDSVRVTIAPTREIVVWSASGFYSGTFREVADATAAGGERGYDANQGRPKVAAPSSNPANRISLGFVADPTQTYKLWIRLKAEGNHWSNDSVWVQFTGSTDAAGRAVYRYGTSSGLAVNLEECSGCGVSGWGWEDDGWGAANRNGVTLRFPAGGWQSIIIQTREDGVSIDQVVLSSEQYLHDRPGSAKDDATILPFTIWQEEG